MTKKTPAYTRKEGKNPKADAKAKAKTISARNKKDK